MLWNAFKIAFSMYSKIPMPSTNWDKKNMKYAMCFFPLVGGVIGLLTVLWGYIASKFQIGGILYASILTILPILITGGIHFDGFLDTMDALSSYQPIEKKLEILKDPHTGAFAIISGITYFIFYFGVLSEVKGEGLIIVAIGFMLSRALSGLSIVTFTCAKNSGLAASFSDAAQKDKVKYTMIVYILLCSLGVMLINSILGIATIIIALSVFIYYKSMSKKKFGGITGDIAGYFLQICELSMAIGVVVVGKIFF